jgi:FkbM family methyltransferase
MSPTAKARAPEDQPFQHYTARHRAVSWVSRNLFDRCTYTVRHGLLRGMRRRGGLGWTPRWVAGATETAEDRFWRNLPLDGLVVYDVGAFEGLLTLFFASRAKQVVCFEPNSRNRRRLKTNLELNGLHNVVVRDVGIGETPQEVEMSWDPTMPGGASVASRNNAAKADMEKIRITTLDAEIHERGFPVPNLIKIDIEGWELQALRGAPETLTRHRPALYLEMHGDTMAEKKSKVAGIVAFLEEIGYPRIEHVETASQITSANSAAAAEGHLYCPAPGRAQS